MLGSKELKAAYLEECGRNQREYDRAVRISYKQSYTDFTDILYDEYMGAPPTPQVSYEKSKPIIEPIIPATVPVVETVRSSRDCPFCLKNQQ